MKRFSIAAFVASLLVMAASAQAQTPWPYARARADAAQTEIRVSASGSAAAAVVCWADEGGGNEIVLGVPIGGTYTNQFTNQFPPTCKGQLTSYTPGPGCGGTLVNQSLVDVVPCVATPAPPNAPTAPSANAVTGSATKVEVGWTDSVEPPAVDTYKIRYCEGVACAPNLEAGQVAPGVQMFTVMNLEPNTPYEFQVCAMNAGGTSCTAMTSATTNGLGAPNPPVLTVLGPTSIEIQWVDTNGDSYDIEYCLPSGPGGPACIGGVAMTFLANVAPGIETFTHMGLMPGTDYQYRICARADGEVACSGDSMETTDTIPAPGALTATALSASEIEVNFGNPAPGVATSFNIFHCATPCTDADFGPPLNVPATTPNVFAVVGGLTANTEYLFKASTLVNGAESLLSAGTMETTLAGGTALVAQTGLDTCYDAGGNVIACAGPGDADGQDGQLMEGVVWPSPRFVDAAPECGGVAGVFLDNLTKLCYMKNMCDAVCVGPPDEWLATVNKPVQTPDAVCDPTASADCAAGCTHLDGDGSLPGDWYVANLNQALSLIDASKLGSATDPGIPQELIDMLDATELACWNQELWTSTTADAGGVAPFTQAYTIDWQAGLPFVVGNVGKVAPFNALLVKNSTP